MATLIRAELSKENKYYIEKHRYYELKHFCLQYPIWKRTYANLDGYDSYYYEGLIFSKNNSPGNPTAKFGDERVIYFNKMKLIEQAAIEADPDLASYILKAVTKGLSFDALQSKYNIPCSKGTYYDRYRRFFWILDKTRN